MKLFLIIALLCAAFVSFSRPRTVRSCGWAYQTFAITACAARIAEIPDAGEQYMAVATASVTQQADGTWCYQFETDFFVPEPLPSPIPFNISQSKSFQVGKYLLGWHSHSKPYEFYRNSCEYLPPSLGKWF